MNPTAVPAIDRVEFGVRSNGGDWLIAWHPPISVPDGTPHGASGWCLTDDGVVLISDDGQRWDWPGGRPEGDESWEDTFRREMLEETCSVVREATLLGYCRARCLSGHEQGLVLVRSIWLGRVDLLSWEPRYEIPHRRVVPARALREELWMLPGFEPIFERAMIEAKLPEVSPTAIPLSEDRRSPCI